MIRLVAMVSFWDEEPALMKVCLDSLVRLGVTHLVAVDGVLDLYPGGSSNSPKKLHECLLDLADQRRIDILLYRNQKRWSGNEVGKRQVMLDLALALTTEQDWLVIWDTDYVLLEAPDNLKEKLSGTDLDYADLLYGEDPNSLYKARLLMRARRGLHLTTNHYIYYGPQGDQSWFLGTGDEHQALQLTGELGVHHNRALRPEKRLEGRSIFYQRRDELGVEWR